MPNHVLNLLSFQGDPEAIERMKQEIQNEENGPGSIDFNKLIPMPPELAIESGSRTHDGIKLYNDFLEIYKLGKGEKVDLLTIPEESERAFLRQRKDIPEATWKLGRAACRNIQIFGCPTWYEWCNRHWDTKWNAYDFASSQDVLSFNTAWAAPHPVIQKLSERYPAITITHSWADEDIGHNCGRREYLAGEITEEYIPADGRDAYEFSADVRNEDLADYGLVLNADQTNYIWTGSGTYTVMELLGQNVLYTGGHLAPSDIPFGTYLYYLGMTENRERFCAVMCGYPEHFGGSIVTMQPIDLGENGVRALTSEEAPRITDEKMSFWELLQDEPLEEEGMGGMQL